MELCGKAICGLGVILVPLYVLIEVFQIQAESHDTICLPDWYYGVGPLCVLLNRCDDSFIAKPL